MRTGFTMGRTLKPSFVARALASSSLVLLAMTGTAHAQATQASDPQSAEEDQGARSEIVVTAQRRTESIQSVPSSVSAITAASIEKSNIRGVEGFLAQTPNVSFVSNGSRDRKDIAFRGVSNQLDPYLDSRPAAFAFYIDDFNVNAGTSNPQIVDLERIEVLRGPQGTYFGRNATAGAINVSTKKPTGDLGFEATLGYSSFDTKQGTLVLNVPIAKDLLSIRMAGEIESSDGNIKNINALGGGNTTNYKTGRIIARFTPASNITSDLSYNYTRERNGMRAGVPTGFVTATWANVYYKPTLGAAAVPGFIGIPDGVGFYPTNTDKINFNRPQSVGTDFWYISDKTAFDFGPVTLTSVVGYIQSENFNRGDVDGGSKDYFYEINNSKHASTSAELRLSSNGKTRLEWTIGATWAHDTGSTFQSTLAGADIKQILPARIVDSEGGRTQSYGSTDSMALFGQATYNLSGMFAATFGIRYTTDDVNEHFERFNLGVRTDLTERSVSYDDFSPRFNLTFKPSRNLMFYATASKGYKAGGVQTLQALTRPFYLPETLWSYEGGVKVTALGGRLRADLAGFYTDWNNVQQQTRFQILTPTGSIIPVTGIENAAKARSKGFDGSFDFRPITVLSLGGHLGYTDGKFVSWPNALIDGAIVNADGRPLINAPKWTAGAYVDFHPNISDKVSVFVRPEWSYRSEKLSSVLGIRYFQYPFISPGYSKFNLRAGLDFDNVSINIYAENIFNKKYYENVYEKAFISGVQLEPSVRRFGLTLRIKS